MRPITPAPEEPREQGQRTAVRHDQQVSWEDVLELVTRLDGSGFADAEITLDGVTVRVSRTALLDRRGHPLPRPQSHPWHPRRTPLPPPPPRAAAPAAVPRSPPSRPPPDTSHLVDVTAPMLGVAYLRPRRTPRPSSRR